QADADVPAAATLANYQIDPNAMRHIPKHVAESQRILPIQMSEDRIVVAMADASDVLAIDEVRTRTGRKVEPIQVPEHELLQAIQQYYTRRARSAMSSTEGAIDVAQPLRDVEAAADLDGDMAAMLDQAPVVRLVQSILGNAVRARASDVHVEPREDGLHVRYRVDGELYTPTVLSSEMQPLVISRLKIMANMDIADSRLPQDNRAFVSVDERPIDLRVSTMPTYFGEKVVLRILDKAQVLIDLSQLGFGPQIYEQYEQLLHAPQGMILVTGPTGSGKSTTLYASLQQIKTETRNIMTVEDPIEYQVDGINQSQVHPRIDLSFARCLRSILRQDPDTILVGEIRDAETADMAFRAALTGHLVLSTLHTNDAPGATTRLIDMGVEPYLIASSVIGVLAQRLVRRLCSRCRAQTEPTSAEIDRLGLTAEQAANMSFYRGRGCEQCRNTGYYGRVACFELMPMNNDIRRLVMGRVPATEIRQAALTSGMATLRADGLQKIHEGVTGPSELLNILFAKEPEET
ncbi:MAG: GspE/PulE family protein, partial [Armatimonadota bacterium]